MVAVGGLVSVVGAWILSIVLVVVAVSDVHLFVVDVIKSFDTADRRVFDRVLSCLGLPACLLDCDLRLMLVWVNHGHGMEVFVRGAR